MKRDGQYTVVDAHTLLVLIERVDNLMLKGWKPQGGICVFPMPCEASMGIFFQAMVRVSE